MFSRLFSHLRNSFRKFRPKPLVQHKSDIHIVRQLHGRRLPSVQQVRHAGRVFSVFEKRMVRWSFLMLMLGCIWFGVDMVQAYRTVIPAVGGRYTEAIVGAPSLVNPLFASLNDVDVDISRLVYSGLMRFDAEQNLVPDVAERYELSEDKKTYTFYLRDTVKWHDGQPFTTRDIKFTFDLIQDSQVNSPLRVSFQGVSVQVVDDRTITFTLPEPYQPFLSSLTIGILPQHIWGSIPSEQIRLAKHNLQPVGTGPYKFSKLAKENTGFIFQYELVRNEQFYREPPFVQEFVFRFFSEYETDLGAIYALRQQKVDGLHFVPSSAREKVERKHIAIKTLQLPQYSALFFNQEKQPLLEKKEVRSALAYALDKERIVRESLDNKGQVVYSPVLPGFPGYSESIEKTLYSVEEANALLDKQWSRLSADEYREKRREALLKELQPPLETTTSTPEQHNDESEDEGISQEVSSTPAQEDSRSSDIEQQIEMLLREELHDAQLFYRTDKDGNIIRLKLVTADTPEYRKAAELIAGFWQELGIVTDISFVAPKDISRDVLKTREYDVLLYGIIVGSDPDQYPFWHSSQVKYPGLNLSLYINRKVDEVLEKIQKTDNEEEVAALYTQFQQMLLEDQPAIFLYTPIYRYAQSTKVHGMNVERIFHPADRFANVCEWYVETKGDWNWGSEK